ncbi:ras-related protein Rab-32B-like [Dermacentor albipictus]|uniref:ras-related protein Rab-32B-like n=1 Tax=Dermacentor albipictus TaxID=60249 RepID=UPI0038FCF29C
MSSLKEVNRQSGSFDSTKYDIEDLLFKILVIGDFGVGKTSLIRRYTEGVFDPAYKITIGVDFALKHLVWNSNKHITLQLWDIAGHERFGYMTRVYYKYATAAVIVYDLSRPTTLHSVLKWKADITAKVEQPNGRPLPVLLVANKCDLGLQPPNARSLSAFCQEHGFAGWFPTSAKENININEAMLCLVEEVLAQREECHLPGPRDQSLKRLGPHASQPGRKPCCH